MYCMFFVKASELRDEKSRYFINFITLTKNFLQIQSNPYFQAHVFDSNDPKCVQAYAYIFRRF